MTLLKGHVPDHSTSSPEEEVRENCDIRKSITRSSLPKAVKEAPISKIIEHLIDDEEIERLTNPGHDCPADRDLIEKRRQALSQYKGRELVCILILLPGVRYTIEIDIDAEKVVYWECEPT